MNFAEIFAAGIWVASAIEVAGFTWKAYTATYEPFTGPPSGSGGGGGGGIGGVSSLPGDVAGGVVKGITGSSTLGQIADTGVTLAVSPVSGIQKIMGGVGKLLGSIFGG